MKVISVLWDVPATREDGKALPKAEIQDTEVSIAPVAADGTVGAYTSLAKVKPDATQTVTKDVPDGSYRLKFVVTDIYGQKGKPVEASAVVKSAPPGTVLNIKVTVE